MNPVTNTSDNKNLTLEMRDYFAAQCVNALIPQSSNPYEIAQWAYKIADAMIATREGGA